MNQREDNLPADLGDSYKAWKIIQGLKSIRDNSEFKFISISDLRFIKESADRGRREPPQVFQPFNVSQEFIENFRGLYQTIRGKPSETETSEIWENWYAECVDSTNFLVDFEYELQNELSRKYWYLLENPKSLEFIKIRDWVDQSEIFDALPRITQQCLEEAGKCAAFGFTRGAITLGLQAVESAMRYCYFRFYPLDTNNRVDWGDMQNKLHGETKDGTPCPQNKIIINDIDHKFLDDLRNRHRNLIAHGRNADKKIEESDLTRFIYDCWVATKIFRISRKPLKLHLEFSTKLTIESILSAYLYYWNEELPEIKADLEESSSSSPHWIEFKNELAENQINDSSLGDIGKISSDASKSLCEKVVERLHIQKDSQKPIEKIIFFSQARRAGKSSTFKKEDQTSADLGDIITGIIINYFGQPRTQMAEAFKFLNDVVSDGVDPDDNDLVRNYGMKPAFDAIASNS